ncbi:MAG: right-handed parallel beta-helix repeat-containing protein [Spirochaetia bacterium]|nr:right-handed parallel beta-helix repeat-containing protein [Spirochaetia bacterium]
MKKHILFLFFFTCFVWAREWPLSPSQAGEKVIGKALSEVSDGDVIRLKKGLYRETLIVETSIQIIGEPGVVIDPSERLKLKWEADEELGPGVYRAAFSRQPTCLMVDGKIIASLDENRVQKEGPWHWQNLFKSGTPVGGFKFIKGIWLYRSKEKSVILRLEGDLDPNRIVLSVLWDRAPAIAFRNTRGASVQGLSFAHAYTGVSLGQGVRQCVVRSCAVGPYEQRGIELIDGAGECLVESNEVFRGSLEDWTPPHSDSNAFRGAEYEVWKIHKNTGYYDRVGIQLFRSGTGNRIHANRLNLVFDGINVGDYAVESLSIPLASPEDNRDTEIWENVIQNTRDSGMEVGAGGVNLRIHHNLLIRTHGGLRYKLPRLGPIYIYRNFLIDSETFNIWYSMDSSPAEGYVYHNTVVGSPAALQYSSFQAPFKNSGAPNWHYLNNLFVTKAGFFLDRQKGVVDINFTADYNGVSGGGKPWPNDPSKETHSLYLENVKLEGTPPRPISGSPVIDAGLDLSTYLNGKPLPGCEGRAYKGKAPDLGALEVE